MAHVGSEVPASQLQGRAAARRNKLPGSYQMFDAATGEKITIGVDEQVSEVRRELAMRQHQYPALIAKRKLSEAQAERRILVLRSILQILEARSGV